ncbi:MAG: thioesterase family protein, partial [Chloroflexia bacterium]
DPTTQEWRFCHTEIVRFADIDMFNHVNNAAYLTYVESARVAYYAHISGLTDPHAFDLTVARAEIDFKKPVFYPATIHVYTRATRIGTKSWTLEHDLRDASTSDLLAHCTTILVHFDHNTGQSSPIPPHIIARIEAHEGRPLKEQP